MDLAELKSNYAQEQKDKKKQQPFLLFELASGKENAHTRVLAAILSFRNHMFLPSFLKILGLNYELNQMDNIEISDQESAIGLKNKSTGYIDLYVKFNVKGNNEEHKIIIENKVFGATDSDNQIDRYIASIKKEPCNKRSEFDQWIKDVDNRPHDELKKELENCHISYLTLDGGDPTDKSFNKKLKECIDYHAINYIDNIIPWIRETVLKECPYHDGGVTIAGLIQYIAALERLCDNTGDLSEAVKKFILDMKKGDGTEEDDSKKYNKILETMKEIRSQKKSEEEAEYEAEYEYSDMLWAELKKAAEGIYSGDVEKPWILHFTPSFLCLYKPEWMNIGKGKYSIPFVHFYFPNVISQNQQRFNNQKWILKFEHLNPTQKELHKPPYYEFLVNNDKTIGLEYILEMGTPKKSDLDNKDYRKQFFTKITEQVSEIAGIVDECIAEIRNKQLEDDYTIAYEILKSVFPKV